ncbi:MAG: hypothetical protein SO101_12980 [Lachnospiraceae bacterium]|nr:hypothetical protein [Lachnospiraceae bacterium]
MQILRSLILFVLLFNKTPARTSLTSWVRDVLPNSISLAVLPSMDHGLISPDGLTLSGDGTAVISHSSPYGKHLSSCSISCPYRHDCDRHYSDPNAGWGWDSDNL